MFELAASRATDGALQNVPSRTDLRQLQHDALAEYVERKRGWKRDEGAQKNGSRPRSAYLPENSNHTGGRIWGREEKGWGASLLGGWRIIGRETKYLTERYKGKINHVLLSSPLIASLVQSPTIAQTPPASPPPPAFSPFRTLAQIRTSPLERRASAPPCPLELTCEASSPMSSTQAGWPRRGPRCTHNQGGRNWTPIASSTFFFLVALAAWL